MGFRIQTNIAALGSHTNATMNNRRLDDSLAKLSSGLRINKAADDASGLAIANSLRSQASSLGQAISNGNDAIGLIQTADGALSEYSNILDTIKTKAVQAASDGQNTASRLAIQKDIDKLMEELNMIAKTTSFNGQKLLSGTFTNKEVQVGAYSNESVKMNIGSTQTNQIGHTSRTTLDLLNPAGGSVQLNITSALTGKEINLKEVNLQFNNATANGMGALADEINRYSGETGIKAVAIVSTTTAPISAGTTGSDFAINGINIGSVIVEKNDNNTALLSAINSKTTETGVSAAMNQDGSVKLTSSDGRAIQVTGNVSDVFGKSSSDVSTLGHLELVQSGASDFQISNKSVGATGFDMDIKAATTLVDSVIGAGSTLLSGSILAQGTITGGDTTVEAVADTNIDALITAGSTLLSGSVIAAGTVLGGDTDVTEIASADFTSDILAAKGSILLSGSRLAAGTTVTTEFTDTSGDVHRVGEVLGEQVELDGDLTLNADMLIKKASSDSSYIASGSTLAKGSLVGVDVETAADVILATEMTLKAGSELASGSILKAGSVMGAETKTAADLDVTKDMQLVANSDIASGSTLAAGSTLGAQVTVANATDVVLATDMSVKADSILNTGSILKAGTVLMQDTTAAETGVAYQAGTVLKSDVELLDAITLTADMTLLKDSTITADSEFAVNDGKTGTIDLGDTTNSTLADISVLTLEDAMKAIDTLEAAMTNLDTIRSDLGSVQNQLVSTINNISVTQVNVKAAESNIRDVDFAAESANFSKFNILAQSGSYAMSQANAVQQNVLRLLQ